MSNPDAASSESDPALSTAKIRRGFGALRFWMRTLIWPAVAPLLVLAGIGFEAHGRPVGESPAGDGYGIVLLWLLGLVAGISGLRWLLQGRGRGTPAQSSAKPAGSAGAAQLAGLYRTGRVVFLAGQLLFLTLLIPADAAAVQYWALAVGAAFALLLLLDAPEEFHPGALALVFVGLSTLVWPLEIFTAAAAPAPGEMAACLPAGLNLYGGCLAAERAPAVLALHVVLALLLHFRRYAPALLVLLGLSIAVSLLGATGPGRDSLIALFALILFFPSRPYLAASAVFARGGFWLLGIVGFVLAADGASGTTAVMFPACLAGLLFSEGLAVALRRLGLHL